MNWNPFKRFKRPTTYRTNRFLHDVQTYAGMMQKELASNAHKGDDPYPTPVAALDDLYVHVRKLTEAFALNDGARMAEHAADCGNVCMLFLRRLRLLDPDYPGSAAGPEYGYDPRDRDPG